MNTEEKWLDSLEKSTRMSLAYLEEMMGYKFVVIEPGETVDPEMTSKNMTWSIDFLIKEYHFDPEKCDHFLSTALTFFIKQSLDEMGWPTGSTVPIISLDTWFNDPVMLRQRRLGAYGWIEGFQNETTK